MGGDLVRSVRRSKASLRRFCVHNGLGYMPTLTFAHEPEDEAGIRWAMKEFQRKLRRLGIYGPNVWVTERGKKLGRLHVHYACNWYHELGAVEVCERCALPALRAKRSNLPPAGSLCVGCIWGHGFVGAPTEAVGDPRGLSAYVSKYAAEDFDLGVPGRNRYHVSRGDQPPFVYRGADSEEYLRAVVSSLAGSPVEWLALHEVVDEWRGPNTWVGRWGNGGKERGE